MITHAIDTRPYFNRPGFEASAMHAKVNVKIMVADMHGTSIFTLRSYTLSTLSQNTLEGSMHVVSFVQNRLVLRTI